MTPIGTSDRSSAALLEISGLSVNYNVKRVMRRRNLPAPAVDGVTCSVSAGEFVAIVGESGSGKTSIANAVLGLAPISGGSVRLEGVELAGLGRRAGRTARKAAQLIMQDPFDALDPLCDVRSIVQEPLLVHERELDSKAQRARVEQALSSVGLVPANDFAQRLPHELSGGQRQRVCIATALIVEPRLLIADEPVSMLDVSVRAEILHVLDKIRTERRMGIMMITHDLPTALAFSDRVLVMRAGRVIAEGTPSEIREEPQDAYTEELLAAAPGATAVGNDGQPDDGPASLALGSVEPPWQA